MAWVFGFSFVLSSPLRAAGHKTTKQVLFRKISHGLRTTHRNPKYPRLDWRVDGCHMETCVGRGAPRAQIAHSSNPGGRARNITHQARRFTKPERPREVIENDAGSAVSRANTGLIRRKAIYV